MLLRFVAFFGKKNFSKGSLLFFFLFLNLSLASYLDELLTEDKPDEGFHFPEYAYKETSKNERIYTRMEIICSQHSTCEPLHGLQKKKCIRRCISRSCYNDIYAFDELEEGEIDVRLNSFKGCVIQRSGNTQHI